MLFRSAIGIFAVVVFDSAGGGERAGGLSVEGFNDGVGTDGGAEGQVYTEVDCVDFGAGGDLGGGGFAAFGIEAADGSIIGGDGATGVF